MVYIKKVYSGVHYKKILSNVAFAIISVFILVHAADYGLTGIIALISLWVIFDYIKHLEKQADVNNKTKKISIIAYFLTGIISLLLYLL
ncbi:hypothetical protein AB5I83_06630 [Mesobacillus sp. LC4]